MLISKTKNIQLLENIYPRTCLPMFCVFGMCLFTERTDILTKKLCGGINNKNLLFKGTWSLNGVILEQTQCILSVDLMTTTSVPEWFRMWHNNWWVGTYTISAKLPCQLCVLLHCTFKTFIQNKCKLLLSFILWTFAIDKPSVVFYFGALLSLIGS